MGRKMKLSILIGLATAKSVDNKCADLIGKGYENSKLAVLHRVFDYIQCDPSLIEGEKGWETNTSFLPDGHCVRELEDKMTTCEALEDAPICNENGDDFKPLECMKSVVTCGLAAFRDFVLCIQN